MITVIYTHNPYGGRVFSEPVDGETKEPVFQMGTVLLVPLPLPMQERMMFDAQMVALGMQWNPYADQGLVPCSYGGVARAFCGQLSKTMNGIFLTDIIARVTQCRVHIDYREGVDCASDFAFAHFTGRDGYRLWRSYHKAICYLPEGYWIAPPNVEAIAKIREELHQKFKDCQTGCQFRAFAYLAVIEASKPGDRFRSASKRTPPLAI